METNQDQQIEAASQVYQYAANLLFEQNKTTEQVKLVLVEQGLEYEAASVIVQDLEQQMKEAKKKSGQKDMLYGALWCVGGTIATVADVGYIFWGAIVFGGIQFIKGAVNAMN